MTATREREYQLFYRWAHLADTKNNNQQPKKPAVRANTQAAALALIDPKQLKKDATKAVRHAIMAAAEPTSKRQYHEFISFLLSDPESDSNFKKEHERMRHDVIYEIMVLRCNLWLVEASKSIVSYMQSLLYATLHESKQKLAKQHLVDPYAKTAKTAKTAPQWLEPIQAVHTITGISDNKLICFSIEEPLGEVDKNNQGCGFAALNTTRNQVVYALRSQVNDEESREILAEEIYEALMGQNNVLALSSNDGFTILFAQYKDAIKERDQCIANIKQQPPSCEAIQLNACNQAIAQAEQDIRDFCKQKRIYESYLDELSTASKTAKTLRLGHASMRLYAKAKGFSLYIWSAIGADNHLECSKSYVAPTSVENIHVGECSGKYFRRLALIGEFDFNHIPLTSVPTMRSPQVSKEDREILQISDEDKEVMRKKIYSRAETILAKCKQDLPFVLLHSRDFIFTEETYQDNYKQYLNAALNAFVKEFNRAWQEGALASPNKDAPASPDMFAMLLKDAKHSGFIHYYDGLCRNLESKIQETWLPIRAFEQEASRKKLASKTEKLEWLFATVINQVDKAAIPPKYRALTKEQLLQLAEQADCHSIDKTTGNNLALLALQYNDEATFRYLVDKCQVDPHVCNKYGMSASAYLGVLQAEKKSLVVLKQTQQALILHSLIMSDILLIKMQHSLLEYKAALDVLLKGNVTSTYRQVLHIAPRHLQSQQQEVDEYLDVVKKALQQQVARFVQEIETIINRYAAVHSVFTGSFLGMFNLSDTDVAVMMRNYINQIKRDPKCYQYLLGTLVKREHGDVDVADASQEQSGQVQAEISQDEQNNERMRQEEERKRQEEERKHQEQERNFQEEDRERKKQEREQIREPKKQQAHFNQLLAQNNQHSVEATQQLDTSTNSAIAAASDSSSLVYHGLFSGSPRRAQSPQPSERTPAQAAAVQFNPHVV